MDTVKVPICYQDEIEFSHDHFNYVINKQVSSYNGSPCLNEADYYRSINFMWSAFSYRKRLTESFFLAVHLFDGVTRKASIPCDEDHLGCLIIACVDVACKADSHAPILHYFTAKYNKKIIMEYELLALKTIDFDVTSHHVMHFLRIFSAMIPDVIQNTKLREVTYELVKVLAIHCMSNTVLVTTLPSLLAATLMRVAFAMQRAEIDTDHDLCLQHSLAECTPIAIKIIEHFAYIRKNSKNNEMMTYWSLRGYNVAKIVFVRVVDYFGIHNITVQ